MIEAKRALTFARNIARRFPSHLYDDMVQEGCLAALSIEDKGDGWCITVMRHRMQDVFAKDYHLLGWPKNRATLKARPHLPSVFSLTGSDILDPHDEHTHLEQHLDIQSMLNANCLTDNERAVLKYVASIGWGGRQRAAEELSIPYHIAKKRAARAIQKLRQRYQGDST